MRSEQNCCEETGPAFPRGAGFPAKLGAILQHFVLFSVGFSGSFGPVVLSFVWPVMQQHGSNYRRLFFTYVCEEEELSRDRSG